MPDRAQPPPAETPIEFAHGANDSEHFRAICELRLRVLLAPTGRSVDDYERANPGAAAESIHFAAIARDRVIACVSIRPDHPAERVGRLFQMAVDPGWHARGVGRALAEHATRWAREQAHLRTLFCSARLSAAGFYERLGWHRVGALYESAGLPHTRMEIALTV